MSHIDEYFRQQVDSALQSVSKILDTNRNPRFAADVENHTYDDKYGLAEFLTNISIAAAFNVLERLGLDETKLDKFLKIVNDEKKSVSLAFNSEESCEFIEEKSVVVESPKEFITSKKEISEEGEKETVIRHKVNTKIKEFHWKFSLSYSIYLFSGSDPEENKTILQSRTCSCVVVTTGEKTSPFPALTKGVPHEVILTWLLQKTCPQNHSSLFSIDRSASKCLTPRRNADIEQALKVLDLMGAMLNGILNYFHSIEVKIRGSEQNAEVNLGSLGVDDVFVPVLPLFDNKNSSSNPSQDALENEGQSENDCSNALVSMSNPDQSSETTSCSLLAIADANLFLREQCRSIDAKISYLVDAFPSSDDLTKIISSSEAQLVTLCHHFNTIQEHFRQGVNCIEQMLYSQLIQAVGKEVSRDDFSEYVRFHNRKLLKKQYSPNPFCHAIRRPDHYPDGLVSIEKVCDSPEPIMTVTRKMQNPTSMFFPINASTSVEFGGGRFVHAWINHRFGKFGGIEHFRLVGRARQFSSFVLLIGKISGPTLFEPEHAIILQNKDEVLIPLLLEELPSPKEFKDAIESLSPEQQRFAKAYREMQLGSSVFAVCVIQLKPQLEKLLGLPTFSLTKEIELTQDLLSLFIEYQIPSDLLSFDGSDELSAAEKIVAVKGHVSAVQKMIATAKERDLAEAEKEADMRMELGYGGVGSAQESIAGRAPRRGGGPPHARFRSARPVEVSRTAGVVPEPMMDQLFAMAAPAPQMDMAGYSSEMAVENTFMRDEGVEGWSLSPKLPSKQDKNKNNRDNTLTKGGNSHDVTIEENDVDFTLIPKKLDAKFDELDQESNLRATLIKTDSGWTKKSKKNLLTPLTETRINSDDLKSEGNKAFDLLDALSRSGSLAIDCAELHVMVAATHRFDKSVIATVVEDNVNPIEKMEKSTLIVASTIYDVRPKELLVDEGQIERLALHSPVLFEDGKDGDEKE